MSWLIYFDEQILFLGPFVSVFLNGQLLVELLLVYCLAQLSVCTVLFIILFLANEYS